MCLSIARWFRDDGARTVDQVADEYADIALRIAGFVPDRRGASGHSGPTSWNTRHRPDVIFRAFRRAACI